MAAKIKKGDTVVIIAGKDKGKKGQVTRVVPTEGKVIVSSDKPTRVGFKTLKDGKKVRVATKSGEVLDV